MSLSRRAKRARKRVTVFYDDDPIVDEPCSDITVTRSSTGRVLHSTSLVKDLQAVPFEEPANPWTKGFFEKNSEPFVADSLPEDLPDLDAPDFQLDSNEEIKDQPKVRKIASCLLHVY
jgi:hypothetical protein